MKALKKNRIIGANKSKLNFYMDNIENVEQKKACRHNRDELVFIGTEDTDYGCIHHYYCKGCRQKVIELIYIEEGEDKKSLPIGNQGVFSF